MSSASKNFSRGANPKPRDFACARASANSANVLNVMVTPRFERGASVLTGRAMQRIYRNNLITCYCICHNTLLHLV